MRLPTDNLTVDDVHALIDMGMLPFSQCGRCGITPVSLHYRSARWTVTCPSCNRSWGAQATNWLRVDAISDSGWQIVPEHDLPALVHDDQRNRSN